MNKTINCIWFYYIKIINVEIIQNYGNLHGKYYRIISRGWNILSKIKWIIIRSRFMILIIKKLDILMIMLMFFLYPMVGLWYVRSRPLLIIPISSCMELKIIICLGWIMECFIRKIKKIRFIILRIMKISSKRKYLLDKKWNWD